MEPSLTELRLRNTEARLRRLLEACFETARLLQLGQESRAAGELRAAIEEALEP